MNSTLGADASKIKAVLGDLRMGTAMGDRRGLALARSDQRYFEYDQIGIRGTQRVDIVVHDKGTASDSGCIVALKTAAS